MFADKRTCVRLGLGDGMASPGKLPDVRWLAPSCLHALVVQGFLKAKEGEKRNRWALSSYPRLH